MPIAMQAKILRALQEKAVTPVGGKSTAVNVRIAAATHQDLESLAASGGFRTDLLYRLNVLPIVLPPLRERLADILPLAEHFLDLAAHEGAATRAPKRLTAAAASRLLAYPWPGNIRELRNVMERASVLVRGPVIDADDIGLDHAGRDESASLPPQWLNADLPTAIAKLERAMIVHALDACGGNRAEAARRLSINRQLLYTKMQRHGVTAQLSPGPTPAVGKADADDDAS
jgi:two-component system NtrC family response regulator